MVVGVAVVVVAIVVVLAVVSLGGMISTTVGTAFKRQKDPEKMFPFSSGFYAKAPRGAPYKDIDQCN